MKRTWTIIGVNDVRASFKWYQSSSASRRQHRPTTSSANSSTRRELSCSVSTNGARAPLLDES